MCLEGKLYFHQIRTLQGLLCRLGAMGPLKALRGGRPSQASPPSLCRPDPKRKARGLWNPVSSGHSLYRLLTRETLNKPDRHFCEGYLLSSDVTADEILLQPAFSAKSSVFCGKHKVLLVSPSSQVTVGSGVSLSRPCTEPAEPTISADDSRLAGSLVRQLGGSGPSQLCSRGRAALPSGTAQGRPRWLIYQLHLESSTTRTNISQFPPLQLLHSLCLNYWEK